ncbi:MAG: purine-binding chemotaxis protein CheW [Deltaproteobacteria bacterium]|nr:purine-binding chemotaxis protein CheW [Candidatus Anaeroferrophillus wilburensis]MBN2889761.1 purine-binding chemotaxis protein CheW [Deltaproteobacteria bacterium]
MNDVNQEIQQTTSREGKYLTFVLAGEEYGLEILKVKEIIGMLDVTAIPRTPDYVKGVINLRGKVIPVIDLRLRFGLPAQDYDERTCIVVMEIAGEDSQMLMGIVVDAIHEVLNISADEIEPTPAFGTQVKTDYILGMGKIKDTVKILLDIDRVLTSEELQLVSSTT